MVHDYEKSIIPLGDKMYVIQAIPFDTDIIVDDILNTDYGNILGELLTFPVVVNRIMNLKAELGEVVKRSKFDLDVYEAQLSETKRKLLTANGQKTSIKEVENAVLTDKSFIVKKKAHFEVEKNFDYIDSLYWSAQSKQKTLDRLGANLKHDEQELIEGVFNGVLIKAKNKVIK